MHACKSDWGAQPRFRVGLFASLFLVAVAVLATTPTDIPRITGDIEIDGRLDESAWDSALVMTLEYEVRPGENTEPPVDTEVLLAFDEDRLLVGFRCRDPEPDRVRARFADRDQAWSDDWVGIAVDTFNDQRRAYEFLVNPYGVQTDAINDDVGGRYDSNWNAIWDSAGRLTEEGYVVEMAIPFSQIQLQNGDGPQIWGFDAFRSYPRTDRHHIGLVPRERGNNSYLSQVAKIQGFDGVRRGKGLEIAPTLTYQKNDARADFPDGSLEEVDSQADVGVTLRWGATPNMTISAAVNPDFSQVEADVIRLDINEQFALFFPETRPFFLEGVDTFNTDMRLLHTRNIADPAGALKVVGKQGRHTYGIFTSQDELTNLLVPGAEGSTVGSFDIENVSTVARYRMDFGESSTAGVFLSDREGGDYYNRIASADLRYRMSDTDTLTLNGATSATRYDASMSDELGLPDDELTDSAYSAAYRHQERNWWGRLSYSDYGEDFRADLGFVPQVDFRRWAVGAGRVWYGEEEDLLRRFEVGGDVDVTRTQAGELLEEELEAWVNFELPYQSFTWLGGGTRNRVFEGVEFDQIYVNAFFEMRPSSSIAFDFEAGWSDWIDFTHVRPAERVYVGAGLRYNLGAHLLVRLNERYQSLEVEGGELFNTSVTELRVVYQFNVRTFLRGTFLYTDITRDPSLYEDVVESQTKDLYSQLLFSYKVNPQTVLFLGYSDGRQGSEEIELQQSDRTFFAKVGYAWLH